MCLQNHIFRIAAFLDTIDLSHTEKVLKKSFDLYYLLFFGMWLKDRMSITHSMGAIFWRHHELLPYIKHNYVHRFPYLSSSTKFIKINYIAICIFILHRWMQQNVAWLLLFYLTFKMWSVLRFSIHCQYLYAMRIKVNLEYFFFVCYLFCHTLWWWCRWCLSMIANGWVNISNKRWTKPNALFFHPTHFLNVD